MACTNGACKQNGAASGGTAGGEVASATPQRDIPRLHPVPTRPVFTPRGETLAIIESPVPPEELPAPPRGEEVPREPPVAPLPTTSQTGDGAPQRLAGGSAAGAPRRNWVFAAPVAANKPPAATEAPMLEVTRPQADRTARR